MAKGFCFLLHEKASFIWLTVYRKYSETLRVNCVWHIRCTVRAILFCTWMFNGSASPAEDEMMINSLRRAGSRSQDSALKAKQFTSVETLSPLKLSNLNRDQANTVPKLQ